jgi:hypothetical protein
MAANLHFYQRGDRYWYRRTFRIALGRRSEIRFPLLVSSRSVARQLTAIIDAACVDIEAVEGGVLKMFSRKVAVAGSIPGPSDADLRAVISDYLKDVHLRKLRHLADYGGDNWHVDNHKRFVADFDLFDLILRSETTWSSVNESAIGRCEEDWRTKGYSFERIDRAKSAFAECSHNDEAFPITTWERDQLIRRMGRKLAPHDVDRLERLMCESHREASRRVERRRQWTSANLGVEGVPEAFSNDERHYAIDPLFREILDEHAESINAVRETVAAETAPLTDRFAESAVQSTPSALTLVPIDATVAIFDIAVRQAPLPSVDVDSEHALQPGTDRVSDVVTWGALVNAYIDDRRDSAGRCGSEDQIRTVEKIMVHV